MADFDIQNESRGSRSEIILGAAAAKRLSEASVIVFGLGGVGGACVEALARAGVGTISLVDSDLVSVSNLNRQIIALENNIGTPKTDAAEKRIHDINSTIKVIKYPLFFSEENADGFDFTEYDYIADAIDSVPSKLLLIKKAHEQKANIISAMGTGNKLDPTEFEVSDISKTEVCPLARVIRTELRRAGINHLKVVYSKEQPIKNNAAAECGGKQPVGSLPFVPPVAGFIMAGEIIKDIIQN